jgi:carbonic anhydrase/acetyltransferase-like protein (isoleucine patch superfamily)
VRVSVGDRAPVVADSAWVAPGAWLIGDVTLQDDASAWYGAVLRADNDRIVIGARTNLQDGCVVHVDPGHPAVLGAGISVGHRAILHGCTIEDDVLVGMGAIVMNGARIGANSVIGAGALVPEGVLIPPWSVVVGLPGRVRGKTSQSQTDVIKRNALDYARAARAARAQST